MPTGSRRSFSPSMQLRACAAGGCRLRRRLLAQESGVAAVEFSLILPILLVLWIGGVEVTQALSIDRRLNNLAAAIGDLVARDKKLEQSDISAIFDIGDAAMKPYPITGLSMRVTAVEVDGDGVATVSWSQASQGEGEYAAYAEGDPMNTIVAATLRVPDSQIIMAEAYYTYQPTIGYVIKNAIELEDRMFFVPRLVAAVQFCEDADANVNCEPS